MNTEREVEAFTDEAIHVPESLDGKSFFSLLEPDFIIIFSIDLFAHFSLTNSEKDTKMMAGKTNKGRRKNGKKQKHIKAKEINQCVSYKCISFRRIYVSSDIQPVSINFSKAEILQKYI